MLLFQTVSSINVFAFPVSCFLLARLLNCEPLSRDAISAQRRSHDLSPWKQHVSSARPPVLKLLFIYEGTKSCSLYSHMNSERQKVSTWEWIWQKTDVSLWMLTARCHGYRLMNNCQHSCLYSTTTMDQTLRHEPQENETGPKHIWAFTR